jgi:hypothetical protein
VAYTLVGQPARGSTTASTAEPLIQISTGYRQRFRKERVLHVEGQTKRYAASRSFRQTSLGWRQLAASNLLLV